MPQIVLECSENIKEKEFTLLLLQIHHLLSEKLPTQIEGCKSRVVHHRQYVIGDGSENNAFVHLSIDVLKGRKPELLQTIGEQLLEMLKQAFALSLNSLKLQITVAVGELPDVYVKYANNP